MESKTNTTSEDDGTFNPIGRVMIALVLGISIVILLNLFNRGGHFALLSALFGILLYGMLIMRDWLLKGIGNRKKSSLDPTRDELKTLRAIIARIWSGLLILVLQVLVGFLGLLLLPNQSSLLFAVINGVLAFLLCKGLFDLGLIITVLLIAHKMGYQPPTVEGNNGDNKPDS